MTTEPTPPNATSGTTPGAMALELNQVSLTLGADADRTDALVDLNLDVAPGELVAITGRSGSGKSSLLNVAGGLVAPSGGSVIVNGVCLLYTSDAADE